MPTYHIHLQGIVQGVGFRPFVFQLAGKFGLCGWVSNTTDGVHIEFNTSPEKAEAFYRSVREHAPRLAVITRHEMVQVTDRSYREFRIRASRHEEPPDLPLTPDFALCPDCRQEIHDPANRRYGYAFTTCTLCGPRYSIITALPYDRPHTTMAAFRQCPACEKEYHDPLHRRHFSQTNSCPDCGISLFTHTGKPIEVSELVSHLQQGRILAVKGIGGFLLICDAAAAGAIRKLRQRKHRPAKPLALMYPDLELLQKHYRLSPRETDLLSSPAAPILLLQPRHDLPVAIREIAPGLNRIGCMLPYTPLFDLMLRQFGRPVVATSGNISGSPIIYENEMAATGLTDIADIIVCHNRDIVVPQDDSVMVMAGRQPVILRRSRGLAPTWLQPDFDLPDFTILATGAQLKSSFTLNSGRQLYVSQYLGDMDSYLAQQAYRHTLNHLLNILRVQPGMVVTDLHPGYFTTGYGQELAADYGVPLRQVQHHEAHFYAVLAENSLLNSPDPVLGVIWDGTGYGHDRQIWGGEFFLYRAGKMERLWHLPYFPFILGDKMVREPRISLLAAGCPDDVTTRKFTATELKLYRKLLATTTLYTSSMGRLFDAVAALVLQADKVSYEGEAALYLEAAASRQQGPKPAPYEAAADEVSFYDHLFGQILADLESGTAPEVIAMRFHLFLVEIIARQAGQAGVRHLAFSGGVWQNSLLTKLVQERLGATYKLYFHQRLSPNDECISFGQFVAAGRQAAQ